jgi:WD40 repeat protein
MPSKTRIILLTLLFSIFTSLVNAQESIFAFSGNSRYFAITSESEKETDTVGVDNNKQKNKEDKAFFTTINIFQISSLRRVQTIRFSSKKRTRIDEIKLNRNATLIYAKAKKTLILWSIKSGKVIGKYENAENLSFSNNGRTYIIWTEKGLALYSSENGNLLRTYRHSDKYKLSKVDYSKTDQYIMAMSDDNKLFIWDLENPKLLKRFNANDYRLDNNDYTLTFLRQDGNKMFLYSYTLYDFQRTAYFNISNFVVKRQRDGKDAMGSYLTVYKTQLSPTGKYLILHITQGKTEKLIALQTDKTDNQFDIIGEN